MSVEAIIFNSLRGVVSDRVFPDVAPQGAVRPYITYQQVGGEAVNFVESTAPNKANGRFQLNVWADTRMQASTTARQVEAALRAAPLQTTVLGAPFSDYEPDTKLYGAVQDFEFWYDA